MLNNHYIPYSRERINMTIGILKKYNINIDNLDSLDELIIEAKYAQAECDFLSQFKKNYKIFGASVIPPVVFVANKISEKAETSQMINMGLLAIILLLLFFSFIFALIPIIKDLLYSDYDKYNELIYDLRQIKLFYSKKHTLNDDLSHD